jgi:hypothetical protein
MISSSRAFLVDNGNEFVKVVIPVTVDLSNYYTKTETDTEDADTLSDANDYTDAKFVGVGSLGFQGIADDTTVPGAHVANRVWIAKTLTTSQTFANFGGLSIAGNAIVFIFDNGITYTAHSVANPNGTIDQALAAGNTTTRVLTQHSINGFNRHLRSPDYGTGTKMGYSEQITDTNYDGAQPLNTVWKFGYNLGQQNPSEPSLHLALESRFYNDFELHLAEYTSAGGGISYRPYSMLINRATGEANHLIRGEQWSLADITGGAYLSASKGGNFSSTANSSGSAVWSFNNADDNTTFSWQLSATALTLNTDGADGYSYNAPDGAAFKFSAGAINVFRASPTGGADLRTGGLDVYSTASNFIHLKTDGSTDDAFAISAAGGANGSSYATAGNSLCGIYFDTRIGVASPFRFFVNNHALNAMEILNNGHLQLNVVPEYADNAAASGAGLTAGRVYRTGDLLKIVY